VVTNVKEIEQRNNEVTLVCDNELRVVIPHGWAKESQEADETPVFAPLRQDFVGIDLAPAGDQIVAPVIAAPDVIEKVLDVLPEPVVTIPTPVEEAPSFPVGDQPQ
jgi:hypothetical protein